MEKDHSKLSIKSVRFLNIYHIFFYFSPQLTINDTEVTHNTSTNYAYKTWFDVMASFSPEVKKYRLEDDGSYFIDPEFSSDITQKKKGSSIPKTKPFDKIHSKIILATEC